MEIDGISLTRKKRLIVTLILTLTFIGLILISVITGISIKISNWVTPSARLDVPENTTEENDVESSICEEFGLTSSGTILQYIPELIGVYHLENVTSNENKINLKQFNRSALVYKNHATGIILMQSDRYSLESDEYAWYKKPFRNVWIMQHSISNRLLAINMFCRDPDFPINGACQHGWYGATRDPNTSEWGNFDVTASVTCNMPDKTIKMLPSESICKELEVNPTNTFSDPVLLPFVGLYKLTGSIDPQRVVYDRINSNISLFSVIDGDGKLLWIIGNKNLIYNNGNMLYSLPIDTPMLINNLCFDKEYPANGECANSWFYVTVATSANHLIKHYDIRATIQCTMY